MKQNCKKSVNEAVASVGLMCYDGQNEKESDTMILNGRSIPILDPREGLKV